LAASTAALASSLLLAGRSGRLGLLDRALAAANPMLYERKRANLAFCASNSVDLVHRILGLRHASGMVASASAEARFAFSASTSTCGGLAQRSDERDAHHQSAHEKFVPAHLLLSFRSHEMVLKKDR
jgi:hypothetical protein